MPWKETQVVDERARFVEEYLTGLWTMSDLCRDFGISRKTGHKIWRRYEELGELGLKDQSRAPHTPARVTSDEVKGEILRLKRKYRTWGAPKLRDWLRNRYPETKWPATSTIHELLKRNGLVRSRKQRRKAVPSEQPLEHATQPNEVWCVDFKGWFRTRDGKRCEPLTMTDAYSRFSLCCRGLQNTSFPGVERAMLATFREYGLPKRIRSDNGAPFSSRAIGGLSRFSILLLKLGIRIERIEPGKPQQNGRHERFHKTLKQDTATPPAPTLRAQQRRFDRFQDLYNEERPHESLAGKTPGSIYVASSRSHPRSLPELELPSEAEVRRVHPSGIVKLKGQRYFVSELLRGEDVGLVQESERYWSVRFGPLELGRIDTASSQVVRHQRLIYVEED